MSIIMWKDLIKWFKCKMCCQSKCVVGEEQGDEKIHYEYFNGKEKSFV